MISSTLLQPKLSNKEQKKETKQVIVTTLPFDSYDLIKPHNSYSFFSNWLLGFHNNQIKFSFT